MIQTTQQPGCPKRTDHSLNHPPFQRGWLTTLTIHLPGSPKMLTHNPAVQRGQLTSLLSKEDCSHPWPPTYPADQRGQLSTLITHLYIQLSTLTTHLTGCHDTHLNFLKWYIIYTHTIKYKYHVTQSSHIQTLKKNNHRPTIDSMYTKWLQSVFSVNSKTTDLKANNTVLNPQLGKKPTTMGIITVISK